MFKKKNLLIIILSIFCIFNSAFSNESFFSKAKKEYDKKKFEESKFLFQRNIVFNPKDAKSYLYLAKIFKFLDNQKEELKNIETTLLLEPKNEEALYMLINIELKKSNYTKVKKLKKDLLEICTTLCKNEKKNTTRFTKYRTKK